MALSRIPAVLGAFVALLPVSVWGSTDLVLGERSPFALLIIAPGGDIAKTRSSEIISAFSEQLDKHTDFHLRNVDANLAGGCEGQIICMVRRIRTDYDRLALELPNGTVEPYSFHLERLRKEKTAYPQFLLVLSILVSSDDADRMLALLVDTNIALEIFHRADRRQADWEQAVEAKVHERAVLVRPKRAMLKTKEESLSYLDRLFNEHLRKVFEESGHWEPFGTLLLKTAGGVAVRVDGNTIGTTSEGATRIVGIRSGMHPVELTHPEYEPWTREIEVTRGEETALEIDLKRAPVAAAGGLRDAVFWSGLGVAAIGVAISTAAIVASTSVDVDVICIQDRSCNPDPMFRTFSSASEGFVNPTQEGVLMGPLGYSLIGLGGVWAVGTELIGSEADLPWLQIVSGLAVGALAYGLSAALNGSPE